MDLSASLSKLPAKSVQDILQLVIDYSVECDGDIDRLPEVTCWTSQGPLPRGKIIRGERTQERNFMLYVKTSPSGQNFDLLYVNGLDVRTISINEAAYFSEKLSFGAIDPLESQPKVGSLALVRKAEEFSQQLRKVLGSSVTVNFTESITESVSEMTGKAVLATLNAVETSINRLEEDDFSKKVISERIKAVSIMEGTPKDCKIDGKTLLIRIDPRSSLDGRFSIQELTAKLNKLLG